MPVITGLWKGPSTSAPSFLPATSSFESLVHHLQSSVLVDEFAARLTDSFKHKLEGIMSEPKKRNGRTDEAIMGDIVTGMVAEIGIAELLGVEVFDAPWNLKDRSTFGKDVVYNGIRLEVKSHKHLRRFSIAEHSYHTLMRSVYQDVFDLIVFAHVERGEDNGLWKVTPTLVVDPYTTIIPFRDLWDKDEFSYVYRADLAYKRELCHPLIELEP